MHGEMPRRLAKRHLYRVYAAQDAMFTVYPAQIDLICSAVRSQKQIIT